MDNLTMQAAMRGNAEALSRLYGATNTSASGSLAAQPAKADVPRQERRSIREIVIKDGEIDASEFDRMMSEATAKEFD